MNRNVATRIAILVLFGAFPLRIARGQENLAQPTGQDC